MEETAMPSSIAERTIQMKLGSFMFGFSLGSGVSYYISVFLTWLLTKWHSEVNAFTCFVGFFLFGLVISFVVGIRFWRRMTTLEPRHQKMWA